MSEELLQIGYEVIINIPDENWSWGYKPVDKQYGTKAIVKGFGEIDRGRVNNFGYKPGVYENRHWIDVSVDNKEPFSISSCFIETDKKKYNLYDKKFIRELPETKFWEGDIVEVYGKYEQYDEMTVVGIEFENPIRYRISNGFNSGWYTYSSEKDMTLIKRGNVYKYYNNEPLEFTNFEEEINFYKLLGHYDEVKNPDSNNYKWTKDEVLSAIKEGIVDGFTLSNTYISAIKLRDKTLGERLRKETLKGFNVSI